MELLLFFLFEFFVSHSIHFCNINLPHLCINPFEKVYLDYYNHQQTEEESKRSTARSAASVPYLLFILNNHGSCALRPIGEQGHGTDNDDCNKRNQIPPPKVLQ